MDILFEALKYFGPLIGVFIGWLLTRKNEKDKLLREDKRKLKRTLKTLLDIRFEINVLKKDQEVINIYLEVVKKKLTSVEGLEEEQTSSLINKLENILTEVGGRVNNLTNEKTKESYEKAIENLSEIDPLLAYDLSGKQNIQTFFEEWENVSIKSLNEYFDSSADLNNVIQSIKPKLFDEAIMDINNFIIEIAKKIDKTTLTEVNKIIVERDIEVTRKAVYEAVEKYLIFNRQ